MFDLPKYASKAILWFGAVSLYDVFIENRKFNDYVMRDGAVFALSNVSSELVSDLLLDGLWGGLKNGVQGYIAEPIINGVIYMYLYEMLVRSKYNNVNVTPNQRDAKQNLLIGGVSNLLLAWIETPILSLFGLKSF